MTPISFEEYNSEFIRVNDVVGDNCRIILLLESPHKIEVERGIPLVGRSGCKMSELFQVPKPFGDYVNRNIEVSNIGIMNVWTLPMQPKKAYTKYNFSEEDIKHLDNIRNSTAKLNSHRNMRMNQIEMHIINDFSTRINKILHKGMIFIPCGKFAERVWREVSGYQQMQYCLPHPGYRLWGDCIIDEKYNETIQLIIGNLL